MNHLYQKQTSIPKFEEIFSFENILDSFNEFKTDKKYKKDVSNFSMNLIGNIFSLHYDLVSGFYKHGGYKFFKIFDPKPRNIHKASVRDRIIHHCIYRSFYPFFEKYFIHDSYSCRIDKGTHRAIKRFEKLNRQESKNNSKIIWILKCDIKKCFASVDQNILKSILAKHINCEKILNVTYSIIDSFNSGIAEKGIPLGNLTSQLFINIYMNEFDQFVKRELKIKYYIRYADDFVILNKNKNYLIELVPKLNEFLEEKLKLKLHPEKLFIKTLNSGIDFLGWVHFSRHRVLRTSTKKRMFRNVGSKTDEKQRKNSIASYLGMLNWGNGYKLARKLDSHIIML